MSEDRLALFQKPQTLLLWSCLCGSHRLGGGCESGGCELPVQTTILCHSCCPLSSCLCSHPIGVEGGQGEGGGPTPPPTVPGSAHMAQSHRFCPAHETHLTQNLFQLLQLSLAAMEASLSDASASHTPPKGGEGAHTNSRALRPPPQRPPGPQRAEAAKCPARPGEQGPCF